MDLIRLKENQEIHRIWINFYMYNKKNLNKKIIIFTDIKNDLLLNFFFVKYICNGIIYSIVFVFLYHYNNL